MAQKTIIVTDEWQRMTNYHIKIYNQGNLKKEKLGPGSMMES